MADHGTPQRVEELRRRVNEVDGELVRILNERARIVQELGAYKRETGVALFDPRREEEILRRVAEINEGPIYDTSMRDIFELIMHRIRDLEVERREFSN
ncbi:MAG: chorismate mutase [Rubrobacteraceae bacterium]